MDIISHLARPEIRAMKAYSSARKEGEQKNMSVYLDANENPYPPYPATPETLDLNRYPEPQPDELLELFSAHFGVEREQLLITRGADEAIDLLVRGFCRPGQDGLLINPPTFGMYEISAEIQNAAVFSVPLRKTNTFSLDVEKILATCADNPNIKLIFVCSPNNPTGGLVRREDIFTLCKELSGKALVIADEAYVEFSGQPSLAAHVNDYPNLVVLRTLSKEYSLAGERCGITIAHPAVISIIGRILAPYPLTRSGIRAVKNALSPEGVQYARNNIAFILEQRRELEKTLTKSPVVHQIYPSDANYLLIEVTDPKGLVALMESAGIKIRDRSSVAGIEGCVRIGVGTPEQNQRVVEIFNKHAQTV